MFLSAYSSLSSYEAYEALTDKTKLNKRKYQETSRLHDKNLEAAKYCRTIMNFLDKGFPVMNFGRISSDQTVINQPAACSLQGRDGVQWRAVGAQAPVECRVR